MKKISLSVLIGILLIILMYVTNINGIPKNIILFQGEKLKLNTILGIKITQIKEDKYKAIPVSSSNQNEENISEETGKKNIKLTVLDKIPIKEVTVNVIPKTSVIPLGNSIGLKLYTNGILVVGMSEIESLDHKYKPYEKTGIKEGDMIVSVNENIVSNTAELVETVNQSAGKKLDIKYVRDGQVLETTIEPAKTTSNEYKLGLWVRDAAAGVGTVSFYEPSTKMFAALGHGIIDIDTEKLVDIAKGEVVTSNILSITKGEKGKPGEIKGSIAEGQSIGEIYKNTSFGIYGKLNNTTLLNISKENEIEVAGREEIKEGKAKIVCSLENGIKKEYDIMIEKIYYNNNSNNKSMVIRVTDEELLKLTGGIIQGMSGSPIIQNGKFCGAVTHVLVNDPTKGYGVFGDLMIKQMREVK